MKVLQFAKREVKAVAVATPMTTAGYADNYSFNNNEA